MAFPERGGTPEPQRPLYHRAAQFSGERAAGRVYGPLQALFYARTDTDLSVYRLQLNHVYHVAVLGLPPPTDLERRILRLLSRGEPATLPSDVLAALVQRRREAITQAPWVERHHRPGEQVQH